MLSKREGTWRRRKCSCRITGLWRGFGTWPTGEFKKLSEAAQQEFMRSIADSSGPKAVAQAQQFLEQFASQD